MAWPNGQPINGVDSTPQAPASCVFNGQLFLFWKANDSTNRIFFSASPDGSSWPSGQIIDGTDSTPQALGACLFNNQLFLFWKANDPSNAIFFSASSSGTAWPGGQTINSVDSTPQAVSAAAFNNELFLFWTANDPSNRIFFSAATSAQIAPQTGSFVITALQFPNNVGEGTLNAPFDGLAFVVAATGATPPQSASGNVYTVTVPAGTAITLSPIWEGAGFEIVDQNGVPTNQLITGGATIFVQAANVISDVKRKAS